MEIKEKLNLSDIIVLPSTEEIKMNLGKNDIGFIAPYYPEKNLRPLFVIKELDNAAGILTEQEQFYGVTEEKAIYDRLGLDAKQPKTTLSDIGGAMKLKEWAKEVKAAHAKGTQVKGAFLVGPTGSGKTRFVEAFAGDLERILLMLNLPLIMEMENPVEKLWNTFSYLQKMSSMGKKFVLLMDEFEKMVDVRDGSPIQKQFLGQLLTILNDLNSPNGFKIDVVIFATANNVSVILDNNPELLRHGRWSAKFFLNYPTRDEAIKIYELYAKMYALKQFLTEEALFALYSKVDSIYKNDNKQPTRSVYAPAEINALMERLGSKAIASGGVLRLEQVEEIIRLVIPIQKTASTGVGKQLKDAELGFEEC